MPGPRRYFQVALAVGIVVGDSFAGAQEAAKPRPEEERVARAQPYLDAGMPSPDRPWTSEDYQAALKVLTRIQKDKSLPLPRLRDDPSGGMFARMINPENLDFLKSDKISAQDRMMEAGLTQGTLAPLLRLYVGPPSPGRLRHGDELLELLAYTLMVADPIVKISGEYLESLTEEEKSSPIRKKSLDQMKKGMATSIQGVLMTVEETQYYDPDQLRAFAERLCQVVPPVWNFLEPLNRDEFRRKIRLISRRHADERIRQSLEKLLQALPPEPTVGEPGPGKKAETKPPAK